MYVEAETYEDIRVIRLNRPQAHNAWTEDMRGDVREFLENAAASDCRAIVVTGAGQKAFCAGQDLAETKEFIDGQNVPRLISQLQSLYDVVRSLDIPVVCALNGVAAGSGFQFSLLCDVVVAHADVRVGQPEVNSGLPSIFGPWLIAESVGRSRATELCLSGRLLNAQEAFQIGVIHHLVESDQVLPKAIEIARHLADKPPHAFRITKRFLREANQKAYEQAFRNAADGWFEAFQAGEPQRIMSQFFTKRSQEPRTQGQLGEC